MQPSKDFIDEAKFLTTYMSLSWDTRQKIGHQVEQKLQLEMKPFDNSSPHKNKGRNEERRLSRCQHSRLPPLLRVWRLKLSVEFVLAALHVQHTRELLHVQRSVQRG